MGLPMAEVRLISGQGYQNVMRYTSSWGCQGQAYSRSHKGDGGTRLENGLFQKTAKGSFVDVIVPEHCLKDYEMIAAHQYNLSQGYILKSATIRPPRHNKPMMSV